MTDFEAAKAKAAKENKDLLVDFTGSDWCGWCIKLVDEVFKHDAFKKGVADKFVLVELDFPNDKSKLSEAIQKQNKELAEKYDVRGFPTILLLDAKGLPYAITGYQSGGPEKYLEHLTELQAKRTARDEALDAASKLEGTAKAEALVKAVKSVPEGQLKHYQNLTDEIIKLDPEDKTGFAKEQKFKAAHAILMGSLRQGTPEEALTKVKAFITEHKPEGEQLDELNELKLQIQVSSLMRAKKTDEALALIDKHIADSKLEGGALQAALGTKMGPLLNAGRFDDAEKIVDQIIAAGPETEEGKHAEAFKPRLQKMKEQAANPKKTPNPPHGQPGHVHEEE